ncbi:MAG: DUF58 domain-containing protein [Methylacidiphilales bacterium]|nr:DUF58 domain-containing protein [Candidatus Methylacidiphilales bacterium]
MSSARNFKYLPPRVADQIRGLGLSSRRPMHGTIQGLHRSPNFGASVEFAEYRDYAPGDPPNLIDWPVYARTDRYMIRRFQDETNLRACVLVDASASLDFKQAGPNTKFEYACSLAAGFLYLLVCQGDSASLSFFTHGMTKRFEPVASVETLSPVLLEMENIRAEGAGDIEKSLHEAAEMLKQRHLVILISDLLQPAGQVARGIQHLQHSRHEVAVLHILDGAEIALPLHGLVELRDMESGEKLLIEADEIRAEYSRSVQGYIGEISRLCVGCGAAYYTVDTRTPMLEALAKRAGQ